MSSFRQLADCFSGKTVFSNIQGKWGYELRKADGRTYASDFVFETQALAEREMTELLARVEEQR